MTTSTAATEAEMVAFARQLEAEMVVVARRVRRAAMERAVLMDPGIGPLGYGLLEYLRVHGPARGSDLAAALSADKGAVSRAIQALLEAGLAQRATDPVDGRAFQITLTEEAFRRFARMREARRDSFIERFRDWDADDLARFIALLTRYNATLER